MNLAFQSFHGLEMFFFPISVPIDFVPTHSVESSLGNVLVIVLLELIFAGEDAAAQRGVGVECDAVVAEAGQQLLLHLARHHAVHTLVHTGLHPAVRLATQSLTILLEFNKTSLTLQTLTTSDTSQAE